ncbi:M23 family metallopeptidase [Helicobacter canis]|uniref:Putative M23/M37 family peptidase n=1 Tax=Helicobacter canis TaxID=29419 RepID=A0A377J456_9HELI|nr:M23 family metallopeptidase [Helicobacter canis]STO97277.1 putative M23/M37 family peptidase [Helicobacter canis]
MSSSSGLLRILVVIALGLFGYFLYTLDLFKSTPIAVQTFLHLNPTEQIPIDDNSAWNPERRISLEVESQSKIKSYKIRATTGDGVVVLEQEEVVTNRPEKLRIWLPRPEIDLPDNTKLHYEVAITDWSNANFFSGETLVKHLDFTINTKQPVITILAHSPRISYGGSALVVFQVESVDIKSITITNGKDTFVPFPFVAQGYYAVILAWPLSNQNFSGRIQVSDTALNARSITIPFIKDTSPRYQASTLKLQEQFLRDKMDGLISEIKAIRYEPELDELHDDFEKFVYINEQVRLKDEAIIAESAYQACLQDAQNTNFPIEWGPFIPLKGYSVVGRFGDKRTYVNAQGKTSQSLHLGLDIASVKNDRIIITNNGRVILGQKLGVYGNTIMIDHGFGVASLYAHLSDFLVSNEQEVLAGDVAGLTGESGWAFGDHLHFGMLVQGLSVRNVEWLDSRWIKHNITDILAQAKLLINQAQ